MGALLSTLHVGLVLLFGGFGLSADVPAGTIAFWSGNGNANSSVGGHNGTLVNGAGFAAGQFGQQAFSLNSGSSQFISVPNSPAWDFGSNPFSIAMLVNFTSISGDGLGSGANALMGHDEGGGPTNKWFFSYMSDGTLGLHINNVGSGVFLTSLGTVIDSTALPAIAAPLTIGQTGEGIGFVNGRLQNVQVCDTALSASEVAALLVPEPSTLAGCVVPFGSLGMYRLRRRRMVARATTGHATAAAACLVAVLVAATTARAAPITIDMVTVGNPGNAGQTQTYTNGGTLTFGAVAGEYQIGKYAVTIGQYTAFLNSVAKTDTYSLYHTSMGTNLNVAGISRTGSPGSYTYSVMNNGGNSANRPITFVSWWDAARFANWMANGQPTGAQTNTTTENGAYNVNGATSGPAPGRNVTNPNTSAAPTFYIPTENEWYKAAFYSPVKGGVGVPGYYAYATQSDSAPGNTIGSGANQANYLLNNTVNSVTQSSSFSFNQNYLTDVGAFTNSASFYGTFDQSGNVYQWNDLDGLASSGSSRGILAGHWAAPAFYLSSSFRNTFDPSSLETDIHSL